MFIVILIQDTNNVIFDQNNSLQLIFIVKSFIVHTSFIDTFKDFVRPFIVNTSFIVTFIITLPFVTTLTFTFSLIPSLVLFIISLIQNHFIIFIMSFHQVFIHLMLLKKFCLTW